LVVIASIVVLGAGFRVYFAAKSYIESLGYVFNAYWSPFARLSYPGYRKFENVGHGMRGGAVPMGLATRWRLIVPALKCWAIFNFQGTRYFLSREALNN
jgi:hypothetical protein